MGELAGGMEGIARGRDARDEEKVVEKYSRGKEGVKDSEKGLRERSQEQGV